MDNTLYRIRKKIVIEGNLRLIALTHLGNGESDDSMDMKLRKDSDSKTPVLPGTTLAGALRSYLRTLERGYGKAALKGDLSVQIFGQDKNTVTTPGEKLIESRLIPNDAIGEEFTIETRDGVAIDNESGTAADKAKYNMEAWAAGTEFPLHLELSIYESDDESKEAEIKQGVHAALLGLRNDLGCITFGARKKRGLGRVHVEDWEVREYDLATREGMRNWQISQYKPSCDTTQATGLEVLLREPHLIDKRDYFDMIACFRPLDSLLVKTKDELENGPDHVQLQARQANGERKPVLPGTSVAGVLRTHAETIARSLNPQTCDQLVESIFGTMDKNKKLASRLEVQEQVLENMETDLIQQRTSINYFTAGARNAQLFNAQPAWEKSDSQVQIAWRLRNPQHHEIGLLLHCLKDVWTEDVVFGSEGSIGRGRLAGVCAIVSVKQNGDECRWQLITNGEHLTLEKVSATTSSESAVDELEHYAEAFWDWKLKNEDVAMKN